MIVVREEHPSDSALIDQVVAAAFGRRDEARLVDALRRYASGFSSYVVIDDGELVASAVLTPVTLDDAGEVKGLGLAPVAVATMHQRRGIGTVLVRHALQRSQQRGVGFVVVFGDPAYYGRFGFKPASHFGLVDGIGAPSEAFQVIELVQGALNRPSGLVKYAPEFSLVLD